MALIDRKAPGQPPKLDAQQRLALCRKVEAGPIPAVDGVVRWRLKDLGQWIFEEFGISMDETTVGRELKRLGYRKLSARPQHPDQNVLAAEDHKKKSFPSVLDDIHARLPAGTTIELWWQDEARVGQKKQAHPALGRMRGTRPPGAARPAHQVGLHLRRHLS